MNRELEHLIRLSETHPNWAAYAMWKAQALAHKYPLEHNSLPLLLSNALRERSKPSTPERPCTAPPTSMNGARTSITSSASK